MSNIPSTAVAASLIPVQRSANEMIRARQVQTKKESHHHEEVEELDDTAVNSVDDENQNRGNGREGKFPKRRRGEKVEIESLHLDEEVPVKAARDEKPHLDISA